jgi:hypothetical protein
MRKIMAGLAIAAGLVLPATPAQARSYRATAVNKVFDWGKRHEHNAYWIYSNCYMVGTRNAVCSLDVYKATVACSHEFRVTGYSYRIRKTDSTC